MRPFLRFLTTLFCFVRRRVLYVSVCSSSTKHRSPQLITLDTEAVLELASYSKVAPLLCGSNDQKRFISQMLLRFCESVIQKKKFKALCCTYYVFLAGFFSWLYAHLYRLRLN